MFRFVVAVHHIKDLVFGQAVTRSVRQLRIDLGTYAICVGSVPIATWERIRHL